MDRDEHERKKAEVIQLFKEAAEDTGRQARAEPSFSPHISGEGNVVAGRDVNINKRVTVRNVVKPGPSTSRRNRRPRFRSWFSRLPTTMSPAA